MTNTPKLEMPLFKFFSKKYNGWIYGRLVLMTKANCLDECMGDKKLYLKVLNPKDRKHKIIRKSLQDLISVSEEFYVTFNKFNQGQYL